MELKGITCRIPLELHNRILGYGGICSLVFTVYQCERVWWKNCFILCDF